MKRTLVLALLLVVVLSASVFADDFDRRNEGELEVTLTVKAYATVTVSDNKFDFKVAGNGSSGETLVGKVSVKANSPIYVTLDSDGFKDDLLNQFVTYEIHDLKFHPGTKTEGTYPTGGFNGTYEFKFVLSYLPGEDWNKILAGKYQDTILWTVTAVDNY
ncbi:MAG TPA: hypothetical protein GX528_07880 [Firmicutes bacterium]|nr:hypothetical protein [Bacillota bacterium]